ncbi:MAG: TonB-dependent receptor [Halioglobus sp.]|nr:TonB-dependent receptor [Halioglobus sp.]
MFYQKKQLVCAVALANLLAAPLAIAQSGVLEEVIVTAQKREQSLQDTPVAISAFNAAALEQQGISDVYDVGQFAPNVQIVETPSNSTAATIAIRGSVTFNPAITWEPPVGLYLDGVFIGKNIGSIFDIVELERVEVLRGPQGTLYGKNTVGGAVNLITRKPSGELGGKLTVNVGNEDMYSVFGSVDTAAVDFAGGSFKANLGLFKKERDGFTDNVPDPFGNPLAGPPSSSAFKDINSDAARLALLWEGSAVDIAYSFDYSDIESTPTSGQLTDVPAGSGLDVGGGFILPVDGVLNPYLTSDSKRASAISNDQSWYENSKTMGHALHIDWDAGNWGALGDVILRSITAYRDMQWEDIIDIDGSPLDFFHSGRDIDYDQTSQEFQLVGQTERTNYVAGLYWFTEQGDVINPISFMSIYGFPTNHNEYGMDNETIAAFGQVDWRPGWSWADDRLTLSVGVRWTEEDKEQYIFHPDAFPVIPFTEVDDSWSNVSPTFIASWELTDDISVYGKVSEGWKSGGFNGESTTQELFVQPYDPEEVTSYELGLKSRWLDDRLQVNLAAFENKLEDMQFTVFISGGGAASTVDNAGKATIRGFELEVLAQPIEPLTISLNYGYLDPEYDEFLEVDPFTGETGDFKDSRDFPYAGENTASLGLQYDVAVYDWGHLTARLDWSYQDDYVPYVNPAQNAVSQIDSYDLLNARLTLSEIPVGDGQSLQIAAWGKNITDEDYRTSTIPFGLWAVSYFGEPRTYGLELSYQF